MFRKAAIALVAASLLSVCGVEAAQAQGSAMRSMGTSNPYQANRMMRQQRMENARMRGHRAHRYDRHRNRHYR